MIVIFYNEKLFLPFFEPQLSLAKEKRILNISWVKKKFSWRLKLQLIICCSKI